jgi:hypothetical protein
MLPASVLMLTSLVSLISAITMSFSARASGATACRQQHASLHYLLLYLSLCCSVCPSTSRECAVTLGCSHRAWHGLGPGMGCHQLHAHWLPSCSMDPYPGG